MLELLCGRGGVFAGKLYTHDLVLFVLFCFCFLVVGFFVVVVVVVWREQVNDIVRGIVFMAVSVYSG